jgi:hypothetical protein
VRRLPMQLLQPLTLLLMSSPLSGLARAVLRAGQVPNLSTVRGLTQGAVQHFPAGGNCVCCGHWQAILWQCWVRHVHCWSAASLLPKLALSITLVHAATDQNLAVLCRPLAIGVSDSSLHAS